MFSRGEEDLSVHSSLLSESSAIAEIEKELQQAVRQTEEDKDHSSVKSPSIHIPSASLSNQHNRDLEEDSDSTSSLTPFSPAYVPTAIEQRLVIIYSYILPNTQWSGPIYMCTCTLHVTDQHLSNLV